MPAIQPARLRQQAVLLSEYFDDPPAYIRSLHHLLEFYSDRAQRPGQTHEPIPLIKTYKVRSPVLRQLLNEIVPLTTANPAAGLRLCDDLWEQPYLEFRWLAASLLGQIRSYDDEVIIRVKNWLVPGLENRLVDIVLDQSLARIREEKPNTYLDLAEDWLSQNSIFPKQIGLKALALLAKNLNYENLPVFYRFLTPFVRETPKELRPEVLGLLTTLVHRSPIETAHFLKQNLDLMQSPDTAWLIRNLINDFPDELQEGLRQSVRNR